MEWISVSDKLPEEGQRVIYFFEHTGISIGKYKKTIIKDDETGEIWDMMDTFYGLDGFLSDDVTHWMPLPEAP